MSPQGKEIDAKIKLELKKTHTELITERELSLEWMKVLAEGNGSAR